MLPIETSNLESRSLLAASLHGELIRSPQPLLSRLTITESSSRSVPDFSTMPVVLKTSAPVYLEQITKSLALLPHALKELISVETNRPDFSATVIHTAPPFRVQLAFPGPITPLLLSSNPLTFWDLNDNSELPNTSFPYGRTTTQVEREQYNSAYQYVISGCAGIGGQTKHSTTRTSTTGNNTRMLLDKIPLKSKKLDEQATEVTNRKYTNANGSPFADPMYFK